LTGAVFSALLGAGTGVALLTIGAGFEEALGFVFAGGKVDFGLGDFCASALSCSLFADAAVGRVIRSRKLTSEAPAGLRADEEDVCESGRPAREFRGVDFVGAALGLA
jgi:hypothetical protein